MAQTTVEYFYLVSVLKRIPGKINRTNPVTPSLIINQMTGRVSVG